MSEWQRNSESPAASAAAAEVEAPRDVPVDPTAAAFFDCDNTMIRGASIYFFGKGMAGRGLITTGDLFDFGQSFDQGILSNLPPIFLGSPYPAFVPRADADGNDIGGIRSVFALVPVGTYTGWNVGRAGLFEGGMCNLQGSFIPFAPTKAAREAVSDPRLPGAGSY